MMFHHTRLSYLIIGISAFLLSKTILALPTLPGAVRFGKKDTITSLLQAGADVNQQDKNGRTALHYAAKYNDIELVTLLIKEYRATIDIFDNENKTPLACAALERKLGTTGLLISYGANIEKLNVAFNGIFLTTKTQFCKTAYDAWQLRHAWEKQEAQETTHKDSSTQTTLLLPPEIISKSQHPPAPSAQPRNKLNLRRLKRDIIPPPTKTMKLPKCLSGQLK